MKIGHPVGFLCSLTISENYTPITPLRTCVITFAITSWLARLLNNQLRILSDIFSSKKKLIPEIINLFVLTQNDKSDIQEIDEKTKIAILENKHATQNLALVTENKFDEMNANICELRNLVNKLAEQNSILISKLNDKLLINLKFNLHFF